MTYGHPPLPASIDLHLRNFQQKRETQPVWLDEQTQTWHIYRYSDVARVLTDARNFGADRASDAYFSALSTFSQSPLPVTHRHGVVPNLDLVSPFLSEALTSRAVSRMQPYIERTVGELLDPLLSAGKFEVMSELARPLATAVLGELVGVPVEERERQGLSPAHFSPLASSTSVPGPGPDWNLVSTPSSSEVEGEPLTERKVVASCYFSMAALADALGNTLLLLSLQPDVFDRLHHEPPPVYSAIEEALRYLPPVWAAHRTALAPVALGGQVLPAGAHVCAWLVSANHDPEQFAYPEHFDIDRIPNRHLSFGDHGTFSCPGGGLARLATRLTIMHIARRASRFELAPGNAVEVAPTCEPGDSAGSPGDTDSLELEDQERAGNRMPDRCSLQELAVVVEARD